MCRLSRKPRAPDEHSKNTVYMHKEISSNLKAAKRKRGLDQSYRHGRLSWVNKASQHQSPWAGPAICCKRHLCLWLISHSPLVSIHTLFKDLLQQVGEKKGLKCAFFQRRISSLIHLINMKLPWIHASIKDAQHQSNARAAGQCCQEAQY